MSSKPTHRDALLQAGKELILERGWADISARDLVHRSDTNLGSIGYHFGSKDALLGEAVMAVFEEWTDALAETLRRRRAVADGRNPLDAVGAGWRKFLDDFGELRGAMVGLLEALARGARDDDLRRRVAHHYEASRRQLVPLITDALDGALEPDEARRLASFLIAVADGLMIQAFLDQDGIGPVDDLLESVGKALGAALRGAED